MKSKTLFLCTECGNESAKWYGKCPSCGNWNTLVEQKTQPVKAAPVRPISSRSQLPVKLKDIDLDTEVRFPSGMGELDRVLGGGAVRGSLVLIGGEPGIGKSTLLLQICRKLSENTRVLYVSGEESARQLKLRAKRLGVDDTAMHILCETDLEAVFDAIAAVTPDFLIVDSIQTVYRPDVAAAPGNIAQIRECTMSLLQFAKTQNVTVFIVGHVNKEGSIAGPKILEHMVDCVLYFEGDRNVSYRILRAAKNRFGSTNEIGVFEMSDRGLSEVPNPSEMLLSGRPKDVPGTCIACVMEGLRPILAEVQALVTQTVFGNPRRMSAGLDYNRTVLLLAVLEKRAGLPVSNCDAYINVVGGLRVDEPAADLAAALAIASSCRDTPVQGNIAAFGEVGLTGELRAVSSLEQRFSEIARMGITRCIIPRQNTDRIRIPEGLRVEKASTVSEAIALGL